MHQPRRHLSQMNTMKLNYMPFIRQKRLTQKILRQMGRRHPFESATDSKPPNLCRSNGPYLYENWLYKLIPSPQNLIRLRNL